GAQRHPRALPQAEIDLDRERPRLGAVPDAAARRPVSDAAIGGAAAQAIAERIYAAQLLVHIAADGDHASARARSHAGDDQRRNPAAVLLRLAALRFRPAGDDLRPAVPVGAGQAQHPRPQCGADLSSRSDATKEVVTPASIAEAAR